MARAAHSLNVLLDQLNRLAPGRNKASDGWLGDPAHAARVSDHNPDAAGIVRARDFTHDPARLNGGWVAVMLVAHRDPRIKYVIWDRRIWSPTAGWRAYTGTNPHTSHVHLSVVADGRADSTALWSGFIAQKEAPEVETTSPLAEHTWNRKPIPGAENVGNALTNTFNYAKGAEAAALRTEARMAAFAGQLTDAQATLLVAISDDETQVTLSPEQLELFLNGVEEASARGLYEALRDRFESGPVTPG